MCDDEEFNVEEVKTADRYDISSENFSHKYFANYRSHIPVCELQNIQEFCKKNSKNAKVVRL